MGRKYNRTKKAQGGDRKSEESKAQNEPLISTADKLASQHGVSPATVKRAGQFADAVALILGRKYNRTKKAQGAPVGNSNAEKQIAQNEPVVSTADKLAAQHGVSPATVKRAGQFADAVALIDRQTKLFAT